MTGMLWLDDDAKRPLEEKVARAASYYKDKYGTAATTCFVSQKTLEEEVVFGKITVKPDQYIGPAYLWLGVS